MQEIFNKKILQIHYISMTFILQIADGYKKDIDILVNLRYY